MLVKNSALAASTRRAAVISDVARPFGIAAKERKRDETRRDDLRDRRAVQVTPWS